MPCFARERLCFCTLNYARPEAPERAAPGGHDPAGA
jgi:hypothetical protein